MKARQLEVFRAIMRQGSLTAAAESLHVSQPAVSKVLRHFEAQIGYRLFERVGGRLAPTAEAHLLFRDADRIFREIESLKRFSDRIRDQRLGLLRIGASAPPTFALLPEAVDRFLRRNPDTRLEIQTLPAEEIGEHILIGDIDLGLTMAAIPEPRVRNERIGEAEIVVVMRLDSPLAALDEVSPRDLDGYALISYGSNPLVGRDLDRIFEEQRCRRSPGIEITLSIAAAPLVERGVGVALVDGLVPWGDFGELTIRPFRPRAVVDIVVSTGVALHAPRLTREFVRDLQAVIANLRR